MCENNPDCKFHKIAKLAADYARVRIEPNRMLLEQALRAAGFDVPPLCLYQRGGFDSAGFRRRRRRAVNKSPR